MKTNSMKKYTRDNNKEIKESLYKKIQKGITDVKEGSPRPLEEFCAEMEANYHIND